LSPFEIGLISVGVFVILMLLRLPIAIALASVGVVGFGVIRGFPAALSLIATDIYTTFSSYTLSVVPMFVLMGAFAYHSGLGEELYKAAHKILGRIPGGLAISSVWACAIFGAVCGSNPATTATIGSIAIPEMKRYKYADTLSTGTVAAAGAIGAMIPPSVIFIIYASLTEQSVTKLFMAGIVPGLLLALVYSLTILFLVKKNPALAPMTLEKGDKEGKEGTGRKEKIGGGLLEVAIVFGVALGGLFAGWFSPTEAGSIGAAGVLIIPIIRGNLGWDGIKKALQDTTRTTAMILFLIAGATIFSHLIAVSRIPFELATAVGNLPLPNFAILLIIMVAYLVLGTFLDTIPIILLTIPIFYPVVVDKLGNDPIWFGVMILMVSAIGVVTPPVGINVYVAKGVAKEVPIETIFKGVMPFIITGSILTVILIAFPQISTFLPYLL